jgi:hypothetical protein
VERDPLFLRTLEDLGARLGDGCDEYEVLGISGLLRRLLVDREPLIDQVNRERHVKVRFRVNVAKPLWKGAGTTAPAFWSREDGLDPERALSAPEVREVSRDGLLSMVVMIYRTHEVTVKDLILQGANIGGVVHAGRPRDKKEEALLDVEHQMAIGGLPGGVRTLQAIGRVVLQGLDPLRRSITATPVGKRLESSGGD